MKRLFALMLALILMFLFSAPALATDAEAEEAVSIAEEVDELDDLAAFYDFEHTSLEDIMARFRAEFGLNENNFAMGYYATGTGDAYGFQVDDFRNAGYSYMVPLNMIYYDKINAGELEEEDYVGTYYIPYLKKYTIVDSDTAMAVTMQQELGDYRTYKEALTQYSPDQEYTEEYYSGNYLNIRYVMNVLYHLYNHQTDYEDLIAYMQEAGQTYYFALYKDRFAVAHKYSEEDGIYNDIAIIYTPEPFLLAAYSQDVGHAENMMGRLAELMTEYTLYLSERKSQGLPAYTPLTGEPTEEQTAEAENPAVEIPADIPAETEKEEGPVPVWVLILVIIVAIAAVILAYMKGLVNGAKMERSRIQTARKKRALTKKE